VAGDDRDLDARHALTLGYSGYGITWVASESRSYAAVTS